MYSSNARGTRTSPGQVSGTRSDKLVVFPCSFYGFECSYTCMGGHYKEDIYIRQDRQTYPEVSNPFKYFVSYPYLSYRCRVNGVVTHKYGRLHTRSRLEQELVIKKLFINLQRVMELQTLLSHSWLWSRYFKCDL